MLCIGAWQDSDKVSDLKSHQSDIEVLKVFENPFLGAVNVSTESWLLVGLTLQVHDVVSDHGMCWRLFVHIVSLS